jgi:hypothetical protein
MTGIKSTRVASDIDLLAFANSVCEAIFVADDAVSAVGVGGSIGHGTWDEYSDVDIFVFTRLSDVERLMRAASSVLGKCTPLAISVLGDFFPGYGVRSASITSSGRVVEIFFVAVELMHPTTMMHKTRILFDRGGIVGTIAALTELSADAQADAVSRLAYDFVAACTKLLKAVARQNSIGAFNRLQKIRPIAAVAIHFAKTGEMLSVFEADSGSLSLGATYLDSVLLDSFVTLDITSVVDAYSRLREPIRRLLESYAPSLPAAGEVCRLEANIFLSTRKALHVRS